jgi:hypothetical protein
LAKVRRFIGKLVYRIWGKTYTIFLFAVFNLPMSTITTVEDALMIGMSGIMLLANMELFMPLASMDR